MLMLTESLLASGMTLASLAWTMLAAVALGLGTALLFAFQQKMSRSMFFALSMLPAAVAVVILLVNGNLGTGVAVAGTMALVRFRSVPGTAREIAAIFTAMVMGLTVGTGYPLVGALLLLSVAVIMAITACAYSSMHKENYRLRVTIPDSVDYRTLFDGVFEKYHAQARLRQVKTAQMGSLFTLTYDITIDRLSDTHAMLGEIRVLNANLPVVLGEANEEENL